MIGDDTMINKDKLPHSKEDAKKIAEQAKQHLPKNKEEAKGMFDKIKHKITDK